MVRTHFGAQNNGAGKVDRKTIKSKVSNLERRSASIRINSRERARCSADQSWKLCQTNKKRLNRHAATIWHCLNVHISFFFIPRVNANICTYRENRKPDWLRFIIRLSKILKQFYPITWLSMVTTWLSHFINLNLQVFVLSTIILKFSTILKY